MWVGQATDTYEKYELIKQIICLSKKIINLVLNKAYM